MNYYRDNRASGNSSKKYPKKNFREGSFGGRNSAESTMHRAICSQCDRECQVPFKPSGDKPVFCRDCFKNQEGTKTRDYGRRNFAERSFGEGNFKNSRHKAICDKCGKDCEVPFKPSGEKPIYCNRCFGKSSGKYMNSNHNNNMTKEQFDILNSKLDKILGVLGDVSPSTIISDL